MEMTGAHPGGVVGEHRKEMGRVGNRWFLEEEGIFVFFLFSFKLEVFRFLAMCRMRRRNGKGRD